MLCNTCTTVIETAARSSAWTKAPNRHPVLTLPHHISKLGFRKSSKQGCYICSSYYESVVQETESSHRYDLTIENRLDTSKEYLLEIDARSGDGGSDPEMYTIHEADEVTAKVSLAAIHSLNTGSQASLNLAKHWFSTCLLTHDICNLHHKPGWYPTRLLDVSGSIVKLIDTDFVQPTEPYATLSHCWGSEPSEHLSTDNETKFRNGLHTSKFAKTFRDAIDVSRRLGIMYIWIDSFCILQSGDPERVRVDKEKEIAQMKQIYSNTILNIGAASGNGPSYGCYKDRRPGDDNSRSSSRLAFVSLSLYAQSEAPKLYQVYCETQNIDRQLGFKEQALFTRAWVMQERILSPRMLYFGKDGLSWECSRSGLCHEELPFGSGSSARPYSGDELNPFSLENSGGLSGSYMERGWFSQEELYIRLLHVYTRLRVSRPEEDKMLAFGGMAERLADIRQDEYVAGFFWKSLLQDLCFEYRSFPSIRLEGPSWSWASTGSPIYDSSYHSPSLCKDMARIHGYEVQLRDANNKYGAVKSASLRLEGRLIDIEVEADSGRPPKRTFLTSVLGEQTMPRFDVDMDVRRPTATYQLLLLSAAALANKKMSLHGLILERVRDMTFVRVGSSLYTPSRILGAWEAQEDCLITLI